MNKNPFVPQPSYTQPPLPPGPPPPQPAQPDYSAYWAAAAQQSQPHPIPPYNQQWSPPPPPRPTPEQNALYANYGYGPQNQWQRQQHAQQQYHAAPPPPVPHAPPPTQAYNPYQPAVYPQPYAPQAPQAMGQPPYPQPPQPPSQPVFNPHIHPQPVQMMQQQQPQQPRHGHHSSPQHQPPAKRQRFDGPSHNQQSQQRQPPTQPQSQNQPPSQPMNFGNRGGAPGSNQASGGGRGGAGGGRGGNNAGRGRGGSMNASRGNLGGRSGRGGSFNAGGGGNSGRGGNSNSLRGHGSRGHLGGNKDFHNRRGGGSGSLHASGSFSHQGSSSFRGRGQGHSNSNRSQRHDGNTASSFGKDTTMSSSAGSSGKKDENRRTLTDFKIVGLEIRDLSWTWGVLSSHKSSSTDVKIEDADDSAIKQEHDDHAALKKPEDVKSENEGKGVLDSAKDQKPTTAEDSSSSQPAGSSGNTPQSRIRVYFHTPVTADDSHPIPHSFSVGSIGSVPSDSRKGKRKKLDDEDDEDGGGRVTGPPPHAHATDDLASVAGSVAETASEADWLMAAITEGDESRGQETQRDPDAEDSQRNDGDGNNVNDGEHLPSDQNMEDANKLDGDGDGLDDMNSESKADTNHGNDVVDMSEAAKQVGDQRQKDGVDITTEARNGSSTADAKDADVIPSDAPTEADQTGSSSNAVFDAQSADHVGHTDAQVHESSKQSGTPSASQTEANTSISTELDSASSSNILQESFIQTQDASSADLGTNLPANSLEHLPEPPASPVSVSNTLLSTSSSSTYGDSSQQSLSQPVGGGSGSKRTRTPSANRLSISYAGGNRRLVIDAEVVETMKVFRSEGRIEVRMKLQLDADGGLHGILVESLSEVTKSYVPFEEIASSTTSDPSLPPFVTACLPLTVTLIAYLDTERPLSEPRWVKTGDIPDWLRSIFGRMFWVAGDAAEGWEKKITVVDPDPPPTIWTVLEGWAQNSPVGVPNERQRFLKTHISETENLLEILLRLVRGERATAFSSAPTISAPSVSGPLLAALSQNTSHGSQQTHVSLAVMAIFQMSLDYAQKAMGDKGATEVEHRIGEIIRCLPSHLIYKSLDGIFKEWRVEKKGR